MALILVIVALLKQLILLVGFLLTAVKIAIVVAIMVVVNFTWLASGSALTRMFRDPRKSRILNIAFAVLLLASLAVAFIH